MALKTKLKINLKDILGYNLPDDEALRLKIGNDILDAIRERTADGKFLKGSSTKGYSKSYKNSATFEAAGKSKSGRPNMTLFGDMMELLTVTDSTRNTITLGWLDEDQIPKAENHLNGVTVPKRDFLGLPQKELEAIILRNADLIDRVEDDDLTSKDEKILDAQREAREIELEELE